MTLGQSNVIFTTIDTLTSSDGKREGSLFTTRIPRASPDLINMLHDKKIPFAQVSLPKTPTPQLETLSPKHNPDSKP